MRARNWISVLFGLLLAIAVGGGLGPADHQDCLHRSAIGSVRPGRRRQPQADAVHHRFHQRQGRRARQEVRAGSVRQQVAAVRCADRSQERDRPEHAVHHAVQRIEHRRRPDRRREQAQRPQPRQPHHLPELRRGGARAHQRAVQLLAFPLRPACRHEGGGDGPRAAQGDDQGLPDQPGLPVRPVGAARGQELPRQAAARRADRRRRADPARQDQGLLALHHEDQGLGRAGADDGQLGPRHEPADQGRRRCRRRPALLHLLCPSGRRADGDRRGRREPRAVGDAVQRERGAGDRQRRSRGLHQGLPREAQVRVHLGRLPHHLRVSPGGGEQGGSGRRDQDRLCAGRHVDQGLPRLRDDDAQG